MQQRTRCKDYTCLLLFPKDNVPEGRIYRHAMKIYTSTYISPLGAIVIESDGETLTGLRFEESQTGTMEKIIKADDTEIPVITEVRKWLDDYFAGKEASFMGQVSRSPDFYRVNILVVLSHGNLFDCLSLYWIYFQRAAPLAHYFSHNCREGIRGKKLI